MQSFGTIGRPIIFFLLQRMGPLGPIERVSSLATGGLSMAFLPSFLVFGAVTHLIKAAEGLSDAIQELFVPIMARPPSYTK